MSAGLSQTQLLLPVLEALQAQGGTARTADVCATVAHRLQVPAEVTEARIPCGPAGHIKPWDRHVRWAMQRARLDGLAQPLQRSLWEITGKGRHALRTARPGLLVTLFVTDRGVALWGSCADALGAVDAGSIQLLLTSPPYPLLRKKAYGNVAAQDYVDWFLRLAERWPEKLTADGSIVLDVGEVWEPARPTLSLYQERLLLALVDRLGLRLCQRFQWLNPSKLPAPAEWVTVRRVRVKPATETLWWLAPHDHPYADNRQVLVPYSTAMQARLAQGGETPADRPSGHHLAVGAFGADNGGAIPPNVITAPNTDSGSAYLRACRAAGLPIHPARFPPALPEFFIKLCTRPDDLVADPFGGSGTTAAVAERLGRRWLTSDTCLEYLLGAAHRLHEAPGFRQLSWYYGIT